MENTSAHNKYKNKYKKYNRNTDIIQIDEIREVSETAFLFLKLTICPYIGSQQNTNKTKKIQEIQKMQQMQK